MHRILRDARSEGGLLDAAQVDTGFEQMRRKSVPQ
jgi:hypothetical protein